MSDRAQSTAERGVSLLEAIVTLALITLVLGLFHEMILGSMRASMFSESHNDLAVVTQRVTNSIHTEIIQAKLVLQEDATGAGYRDLFNSGLPAGVAAWSPSRLPLIDQNTTVIGPDPGPNGITNRTGNSLLLARQLAPIAVAWNHDADGSTPDISFLADRYQFQYYFLRSNDLRDFGGLGYYLEVMHAESQVFADYFQINDVAVNRAQIASGIRAAGIQAAWDPGKPIAAPAFYDISVAGTLTADASPDFTLNVKSLLPDFAGGRVSGKMEYSVAPNPTSAMKFRDRVPLYATAGSGFPQGLEFQIVGGNGSRKAVTRLVLASNYGGTFSSQEASVTSSARGF